MHQHPYFNLALVPTALLSVVLALLIVLITLLIVDRIRRATPEPTTPAPVCSCGCGCQHLTVAQAHDLRTSAPATVPAGDDK
jgi:hypothetical protein